MLGGRGDQRFVFDDKDVGSYLGREFAARFLDELVQSRCVDVENPRSLVLRKSFHGHQKERLARFWRHLAEIT
jgi:hypothetical protein